MEKVNPMSTAFQLVNRNIVAFIEPITEGVTIDSSKCLASSMSIHYLINQSTLREVNWRIPFEA